jgi:hypothetical protein
LHGMFLKYDIFECFDAHSGRGMLAGPKASQG